MRKETKTIICPDCGKKLENVACNRERCIVCAKIRSKKRVQEQNMYDLEKDYCPTVGDNADCPSRRHCKRNCLAPTELEQRKKDFFPEKRIVGNDIISDKFYEPKIYYKG